MLELQESLRSELKTPLGPIYTDPGELLADAGTPLVTVGDVVTYHVVEAGETPAVALVDDRTERSAVSDEIAGRLGAFDGFDRTRTVSNPAAKLTVELLSTLREAVESDERTLIEVDGEEDLATLPALLVTPLGGSVVYGQPGEGMVHAAVTEEHRARARDLLSRMRGETAELWTVLGVNE